MKKSAKMDVVVPLKEFNAALWRRFKEGKIRNVYPKVKYEHIVKKIKTMAVKPPVNSPGEYYLLRKFVVAKIGDQERLACKNDVNYLMKSRDSESKKIKFYIALEEIHKFIDDAHKSTNHGGRDKIARVLQQNGVMNVARDTVELFLSFCPICRPKSSQTVVRRTTTRNTSKANHSNQDISDNVADDVTVEDSVVVEPPEDSVDGVVIKSEEESEENSSVNEGMDSESNPSQSNNDEGNTESRVESHHSHDEGKTEPQFHPRRGHVAILDLTASPDGDYRFILLYLDYQTQFCILRPVKCKCTYEVASHLLDVFTFVGPPQILHSLYDSPFLSTVINEIKQSWPECVIMFSRDNPDAAIARECILDVEKLLRSWMIENNSQRWSFGLRFVQLKKNTKVLDGVSKTPYERFFGKPLTSLPQPPDHSPLRSVQRLENLIKVVKVQKESHGDTFERLQVSLDPKICALVQNRVPQKETNTLSQDELMVDTSIVKQEPLDSDDD